MCYEGEKERKKNLGKKKMSESKWNTTPEISSAENQMKKTNHFLPPTGGSTAKEKKRKAFWEDDPQQRLGTVINK